MSKGATVHILTHLTLSTNLTADLIVTSTNSKSPFQQHFVCMQTLEGMAEGNGGLCLIKQLCWLQLPKSVCS